MDDNTGPHPDMSRIGVSMIAKDAAEPVRRAPVPVRPDVHNLDSATYAGVPITLHSPIPPGDRQAQHLPRRSGYQKTA